MDARHLRRHAAAHAMKLLIVEDAPRLRDTLEHALSRMGHAVDVANDGSEGDTMGRHGGYDAVVLDRMLPILSGDEFLRKIRELGLTCPVIMLTARGTVEDRVEGFELGVDDYLVKPFAMAELLARINAIVRRTGAKPAASLTWGALSLDLTSRRVSEGARQIDLTPTEFTLLELLMRHQGQVVTRKMMCEHVWGFEWDGPTNVIEVHVNRLRKKLDRSRDESVIRTIRGRGYALAVAD